MLFSRESRGEVLTTQRRRFHSNSDPFTVDRVCLGQSVYADESRRLDMNHLKCFTDLVNFLFRFH